MAARDKGHVLAHITPTILPEEASECVITHHSKPDKKTHPKEDLEVRFGLCRKWSCWLMSFSPRRVEMTGVDPGPCESWAEVSSHLLKCLLVFYFFHSNRKDLLVYVLVY